MIEQINSYGNALFGIWWPVIWAMIRILMIVLPLLLTVAYLVYWERKLIAWMHIRIGPNRVGYKGLFQPIVDVVKILLKEVITPTNANKPLYVLAPVLMITPALAAWAVIPFNAQAVFSSINAALLYVMAMSAVGVYGVILAGYASNSKYALLAAMRAAAQMVSYEVAMGFALVGVLMISGSLNFGDIVASQQKGWFADRGFNVFSWNWLPLLPLFVVYFVSGVAETNRHPFDVVEGESEIVAGHMIEYSGMAFAMFFLAEYANMILISTLTALMFLGGWSAPLSFLPDSGIWGSLWLIAKVFILLSIFIWIRASFPRYRYDQIMRLGWKFFIPVSIGWILILGIWLLSPFSLWQ